jgi:hypothetical protein
MSEMGPKTAELLEVLTELAGLLGDLRAYDSRASHWLGEMLRVKVRLLNSDYSGVEYLQSQYHRDGLNEFFVGTDLKDEGLRRDVNAALRDLTRRAYDLAEYIRKNHEITGD